MWLNIKNVAVQLKTILNVCESIFSKIYKLILTI